MDHNFEVAKPLVQQLKFINVLQNGVKNVTVSILINLMILLAAHHIGIIITKDYIRIDIHMDDQQ